jgi:hypothetical protein
MNISHSNKWKNSDVPKTHCDATIEALTTFSHQITSSRVFYRSLSALGIAQLNF